MLFFNSKKKKNILVRLHRVSGILNSIYSITMKITLFVCFLCPFFPFILGLVVVSSCVQGHPNNADKSFNAQNKQVHTIILQQFVCLPFQIRFSNNIAHQCSAFPLSTTCSSVVKSPWMCSPRRALKTASVCNCNVPLKTLFHSQLSTTLKFMK